MTLSQSHIGSGVTRYGGGRLTDCDGAWVQAQARNGAMVIRLGGDVERANIESVTAALIRFISVRTPLVVDLRKLRSLSRSGWRALVALSYWYREAGMPMVAVEGPALRPHLGSLENSSVLAVAGSLDQAMRRLGPARRTHPSRTSGPPIVARPHTRC